MKSTALIHRYFSFLCMAVNVVLASRSYAQETGPDIEYFEKQVRPLLADHCYSCHSRSSSAVMGGLRLDDRAAILKGGKHGPILTPGHPEAGALMRAVRYADPNLRMPPTGQLTSEQVAALAEWIKRGAPMPAVAATLHAPSTFDLQARARHWAWQPVKLSPAPAVKHMDWCRNSIDRFILARLEAKGLTPARPADRRPLLRRVTYDLIGLPPTPDEIYAFLADNSPHAYEKVVDRLLASPHYGERWARHWLDLVRYAETDGHEWDIEKTGAYQYRDYVIRALNADLPYNQFVREHIAGDLLPHPRLNPEQHYNESVLGTGFLFLGSAKHSPVDLKDDEAERTDNQIDVLGKAFLGLGIGCARCHDHKFDAISTRDYYALYGFLKGARLQEAPVGPVLSPQLRNDLAANRTAIQKAALEAAVGNLLTTIAPTAPGWAGRLTAARNDPNAPLYPISMLATGQQTASTAAFASARQDLVREMKARAERVADEMRQIEWLPGCGPNRDFRGWSSTGDAFPSAPSTTVTAHITNNERATTVAAFEPGCYDSGEVADRLQGTLRSPTFTISKPIILYHLAGRDAHVRLIIQGYQRIRDPLYGRLALDIDSPNKWTWYSHDVRDWMGHRAYLEFVDAGTGFIAVDRVGLSEHDPPSEAPNPLILSLLDDAVVTSPALLLQRYASLFAETAAAARAGRIPPADTGRWSLLRLALVATPLSEVPAHELASLAAARAQLEARISDPAPALAATDGDSDDEPIHLRGNYRTIGPVAPRRFLAACDHDTPIAIPHGSGRLQLAERILAPSDPLLARVMVNRLWQHHFGTGIVRTPDDFGVMGERPTHPELLDWLASIFAQDKSRTTRGETGDMPSGPAWSLKKMHRLMVLSSAYRMDSTASPTAEAADPQNRLLHRMPVRRLEAECVRDAILAVSGRLDSTLYGPSVNPFLNEFTPGRGAPPSGPLDGAGRRSIYLGVRRNFLIPMFLAFDYPNPITTIGRRTVSNVPAQALTLLNNPFVADQARVWANRVLARPAQPGDRLTDLYESAFGRLPRAEERQAALAFLADQSREYGAADSSRVWADLCHVLYNVKDFIFIK